MRSSLTNKSRVFFWLIITVQKLFWLTVVQVWAVVGIKWAAMWIPLVTNLILVIQAFKKIHSQSLSSSSKVLTAYTWTSSNLWWSLWLSSNSDYSMILWFYWKAEALCKTNSHWSWKQHHQSWTVNTESVNSLGGKGLIIS